MFDICLLGTGGMMPIPGRFLTSLIVRYNGTYILIDCGEGTQVPLQELGWSFRGINTILFTHYHGDHIMGLPGIIYQMLNQGREESLKLIGPKGISFLKRFIDTIFGNIPFDIEYIELNSPEDIKIGDIIVKNTYVAHTAPCLSYSLEIERLPKFDVNKARELDIPVEYWHILQHGENVIHNNNVYTPSMVLGDDRKGLKVTYSTDTRPTKELIDLAYGSDIFIGEGMYGDPEDSPKAIEKCHSTFQETANIAKLANVQELWLTHFSPALRDPDKFLRYAKEIFDNTKIGKGLMMRELSYS